MPAAALHHPTKGALQGLSELEREGAHVGGTAELWPLVRDAGPGERRQAAASPVSSELPLSHRPSGSRHSWLQEAWEPACTTAAWAELTFGSHSDLNSVRYRRTTVARCKTVLSKSECISQGR